MCRSMCLALHEAHAHCDCCEAMHACACCLCGMNKAHAHCDCCEAMHACVGVCVWACARRMLTVIAARRCMHVWKCVFGMPLRICALRCDHAAAFRVGARLGAIMQLRICTMSHDHAAVYMHV